MSGQSHDPITIDADVDVEMSAPITIAQPAGGIETFPLNSRIRAFLTDLNVTHEESSKRPEFLSEQAYCTLRTCAYEPSQAIPPTRDVLDVISQVASTPGCAYLIVKHFRPLLVDIFARWLLTHGNETKSEERWETELFVLAEIAEFVPELWNTVNAFLSQSPFAKSTPLAFLGKDESILSIPSTRLHLLLLSHYRLLSADPRLCLRNQWTKIPLRLLFTRHPDQGVRYLAVQCYIQQVGLPEKDRVELEDRWVGIQTEEPSAFITYGWEFVPEEDIGSAERMELQTVEGWGLRTREAVRERNYGNLGRDSLEWISEGDSHIAESDLSPFTAVVGGRLTLRAQLPIRTHRPKEHSLHVDIDSNQKALRSMASLLDRRLPVLLTGMASSGKSHLLQYLSMMIYPATPVNSRILTISLADTSIDAKALLGSYVSSPTEPGTFTWVEGALTKAVRSGRWIVLEDIDRAGQEVLSLFARLADSLGISKVVGGRAMLDIPGRTGIEAGEGFALFATRKVVNTLDQTIPATFLGHNYFVEVALPSPTELEVQKIMDVKYPKLAGPPVQALSVAYQKIKQIEQKFSKSALPGSGARRSYGLRDLEKWCARVATCLPVSGEIAMHVDPSADVMRFSNPSVQDEVFLEGVDIFLGSFPYQLVAQAERRQAIARILGEALGLGQERSDWLLDKRVPQVEVQGDSRARQSSTVRVGRASLHGLAPRPQDPNAQPARPYAMTKPSAILLERIAVGITLAEPMLLVGETGTGKTTAVQHVASLLNRPLTVINLSTQTESADLLGGFRPVDAAIPARHLHAKFLDLFRRSFSRKKNEKYEEELRRAMVGSRWKRVAEMWIGAGKLAKDRTLKRLASKSSEPVEPPNAIDPEQSGSRKRRKVADEELSSADLQSILDQWDSLLIEIETFELQHVKAGGKLVFAFVEGPLVQALRCGEWILLDEVNLASQETLESLSAIVENADASVVLTERGDLEPIERHPDFRLFACMNPATDVGKKDLPPGLRMRFSEIYSPPPDDDSEALIAIVKQYLGDAVAGDRSAILDVAEFYMAMKTLSRAREIVDGTNTPPHFSMRTLARALTFAVDVAPTFGLRRGLYEGCLMTFTMSLNGPSMDTAHVLCTKHLLNGLRNPKAVLRQQPTVPAGKDQDDFVRFGHYWLTRGPEAIVSDQAYVITPSVQRKLSDLARIILTGKYPVLIQGPTSAGKTSAVEYLAKQTGHRFIRINNHEHTDIQEYLGTYASDPATGKLAFREGLLVTAVRRGDWLVLDELNLAPTDVLEALNRLLDDNRELVIPETGEVIRPHPHFMLFATQNPPGLYAGRKVLSRAFRNRFLEVHFDDVPQDELQTILCQRCAIAPSYAHKIVQVFQELQHFRQATRMFESRDSYATLRDLFRWAMRDVTSYQQLAENGYMLLAERARKEEDKAVVKRVLESTMKVSLDETTLYTVTPEITSAFGRLGMPLPQTQSKRVVWTAAMQRLFTLVASAAKYDEPVLLIGETGAGKTSVCEVLADVLTREMFSISCHQNMETADMLGSQRPIRDRSSRLLAAFLRMEAFVKTAYGESLERPESLSAAYVLALVESHEKRARSVDEMEHLRKIRLEASQCEALFEWHDGPLVHAMQQGGILLLDELSLADDSVLERLNSVLEPSKTLVLAEKGGSDADVVKGAPGFQIVATMNPGGDFGKKELSPALRNRFTEIWVPAITDYDDLYQIMDQTWSHDILKQCSSPVISFFRWLNDKVLEHAQSGIGLRDLLAWITFSNHCWSKLEMTVAGIFEHAARLIVIDGLELLPGLAGLSKERIGLVREDCLAKVRELTAPIQEDSSRTKADSFMHGVHSTDAAFGIGPFMLPKGPVPNDPNSLPFAMQAPTTMDNLLRVLRACQLPKSILLEGSPGVGKTTLVQALADASGRALCRINLSEQTDLIDLFGSDLPVAGGQAGEFAWQDAAFLTAMKNGHWVLLDEMNLASQAILEGLNAVLDHRGSVFIPELGRTFEKHSDFRIFAAQNPVQQGGGRKGLPKSFLNRFTKVYVQEHERSDLEIICRHLYPGISTDVIDGVIEFSSRLQVAVMRDRAFGYDGSPWEFNLRDIMRCFRLMLTPTGLESGSSLEDALTIVYVRRFRSKIDQKAVAQLLRDALQTIVHSDVRPWPRITVNDFSVGHAHAHRRSTPIWPARRLQISHQTLQPQEALLRSVSAGWLTILVGPSGTGKRSLVRQTAEILGTTLAEYSMHPAVDTMEMLGSFEQTDRNRHLADIFTLILARLDRAEQGGQLDHVDLENAVNALEGFTRLPTDVALQQAVASARQLVHAFGDRWEAHAGSSIDQQIDAVLNSSATSSFEWIDGPLVKAIKSGGWYLINDANLCSSSVLDRLNSLCELNGTLILSERGNSEGGVEVIKPHADFRLFMAFDPRNGELSRAMRNRGIEIGFTDGTVDTTGRDMDTKHGSLGDAYNRLAHLEAASICEIPVDAGISIPNQFKASLLGRMLASQPGSSIAGLLAILRVLVPSEFGIEQTMYRAVQDVLQSGRAGKGVRVDEQPLLSEMFKKALPMALSTYPPMQHLDPHRVIVRVITMVIANAMASTVSGLQPDEMGGQVIVFLETARQEIAHGAAAIISSDSDNTFDDALQSYLLLQDVTQILTESLLSSEVTDVALVHSLLNGLAKGFVVPPSNRVLTGSLDALRRRANPKTGLAQTALWQAIRRPSNFDEANSTVIDALSKHVQVWGTLGDRTIDAVSASIFGRVQTGDAVPKILEAWQNLPVSFGKSASLRIKKQLVSANWLMFRNLIYKPDRVQGETFGTYTELLAELDELRNVPLLGLAYIKANDAVHLQALDSRALWLTLEQSLASLWCSTDPATKGGSQLSLAEPINLQNALSLRMTKQLRLGEVDINKDDLQKAIKLLAVHLMSGSSSMAENNADLAIYMLLKVIVNASDRIDEAACSQSELAIIFDTNQSMAARLATLRNIALRHSNPAVSQVFTVYFGTFGSEDSSTQGADYRPGRVWLHTALTLLDLYVPDIPLDPSVEQYCTVKLQTCQTSRLQAEFETLEHVERMKTGSSQSPLLQKIREALAAMPDPTDSQAEASHYRQRAVQLSAFYQETHRFFATVHRSSNLLDLERAIVAGGVHALQEEENFQSASQAYLNRLEASFESLQDLVGPITLGIRAAKLGLYLTAKAAKVAATQAQQANSVRTVDYLLPFPTISTAVSLIDLQNSMGADISARSGSQALLAIEACAVLDAAGCRSEMIGDRIGRAYQTMIALWIADQNANRRAEQVEESLYRERKVQYEDLPDAEREARELLAMFPQYDDWEEEEDSTSGTEGSPSVGSTLLSHDHVVRLYQLHLQLFQDEAYSSDAFDVARIGTIARLIEEHGDAFSADIDSNSITAQIAILARRQAEDGTTVDSKTYNFYTSPNLPEIFKVLDLLVRLEARIKLTLDEYPDQMVLQHLLDRCANIRSIGAATPVARMLAAMEQLLTHTEDWQAYANKENSLKAFQDEIIHMIISWRRLELAGWTHLLDQEAASYELDTAEWWFRLFQLLIVGAMGSDSEITPSSNGDQDHVSRALPLVMDYLSSSTIGRFSSRLRLLDSFTRMIQKSPELATRDSMQRTVMSLKGVMRRFGQFEAKVNDTIAQRRQPLDKAIADFVKLATWKDVNIESMRASARKTHAQLYKSIRAFRDILKQPVSAVLQAGPPSIDGVSPDDEIFTPDVANLDGLLDRLHRPDIAMPVPDHLIELDKTYKKFANIMSRDDGPGLDRTFSDLDDLVSEVQETVKALQEETPSTLTEDNKKSVGNLQARKRKAFADLLKALRGLGFSAKNRADQMTRQSSVAWLSALPGLLSESSACQPEIVRLLSNAESYHQSLDILLPVMRESLRNHNEDFVTQDLQRAHGFADNIFAVSLKHRSSLHDASSQLSKLETVMARFEVLADSVIVAGGPVFEVKLQAVFDSLCRVGSALHEGSRRLVDLAALRLPIKAEAASGSLLKLHSELTSFQERIGKMLATTQATGLNLVTRADADLLDGVQHHVAKCKEQLRGLLQSAPALDAILLPVLEICDGAVGTIVLPPPVSRTERQAAVWQSTDTLLEELLIAAQQCAKLARPEDDGSMKSMAQLESSIHGMTSAYRLQTIIAAIARVGDAAVSGETNGSVITDLGDVFARCIPFLREYLATCRRGVWHLARNVKSLYRLDHVLVNLFRTLAEKGFCKPSEAGDDDSKGGEGKGIEGMGLGAGTGKSNVSNEIEDESQVEGLKDEDHGEDEDDNGEKQEKEDQAIEMGDDFEGALSDADGEDEDEDGEDDDDGQDENDLDEHVGDVDPEAVDDKFWGDENQDEDQGKDDKTDRKDPNQNQDSEMAAKEDEDKKTGKDNAPEPDRSEETEEPASEVEETEDATEDGPEDGDDGQENPQDDQSNDVDAHVPEAEILDLPEGMDLDQDSQDGDLGEEDGDVGSEMEDDEPNPDDAQSEVGSDTADANAAGSEIGEEEVDDHDQVDAGPDEDSAPEQGENEQGQGQSGAGDVGMEGEAEDSGPADAGESEEQTETKDGAQREPQSEKSAEMPQKGQTDTSGDNTELANQGGEVTQPASNKSQQDRSLGDKFEDIHRMINQILERSEEDGRLENEQNKDAQDQTAKQVEHVREDEDAEMQALGAAESEEQQKLADLAIVDEQAEQADHAMDGDDNSAAEEAMREPKSDLSQIQKHDSRGHNQDDKALTRDQVNETRADDLDGDTMAIDELASEPGDHEDGKGIAEEPVDSQDVEMALQTWMASGREAESGEDLWRNYSTLTSDLSYNLCEQLRLILQPTMATRLQGDYRTGKRLNMRKIIPYIASEYTKDKIWLRRTKPSRREYQVLLSLDDSRSMADSRSVHLAYQTLALVSQALTKLEVGQIGIARFGEHVEMLHDFNSNAFSDAEGARIMNTFTFQQHRTDVARLVDNSLDVLADARRAQSSSTSGDLWQLEIIISDGVCQDHNQLRKLLRRALQERVMIVFLVIDSLKPGSAITDNTPQAVAVRPSILDMQTVAYKEVNGEMKIEMERYLDTFPFEYYVVLRDVEALPEVLSETLRQWIARVSMSEE